MAPSGMSHWHAFQSSFVIKAAASRQNSVGFFVYYWIKKTFTFCTQKKPFILADNPPPRSLKGRSMLSAYSIELCFTFLYGVVSHWSQYLLGIYVRKCDSSHNINWSLSQLSSAQDFRVSVYQYSTVWVLFSCVNCLLYLNNNFK